MENFDLLCEFNGGKVRLPFEKGKNLNPVGIFPSASNTYLALAESSEEMLRRDADEEKIPEYGFWDKEVFPRKDALNAALAELGAAPLNGIYFARLNGVNWIIGFREGQKTLNGDYYNDCEKAKIRYCGQCWE